MSFWWRPEGGRFDVAVLAAEGLLPRFDDREGAEEWLGAFHEDLLELGVAEVSLCEQDRVVYGPMPLGA